MEIFNDFPGKINEIFQVFKSKSIQKNRFGGPTTSKRLEDERERRREEDGRGWRRKEGKGERKMGEK